jgi:hypothetical protein
MLFAGWLLVAGAVALGAEPQETPEVLEEVPAAFKGRWRYDLSQCDAATGMPRDGIIVGYVFGELRDGERLPPVVMGPVTQLAPDRVKAQPPAYGPLTFVLKGESELIIEREDGKQFTLVLCSRPLPR